jgi:hypothetical protein
MPKSWLYFLALASPLIFRVVVLNTGFVDWLWYQQDYAMYEMFNNLRFQPQFLQFVGGWSLPLFIITIFSYWLAEHDEEGISDQFLMLPIAFVPFTIIGDILLTQQFNASNLYVHPLIVIPAGYIYVFAWVILIRVLDKMRLVM